MYNFDNKQKKELKLHTLVINLLHFPSVRLHYDATKPGVIENRICEGTDCLKAALSGGVTSLQVVVVSARSVSRGSNAAVT